MLSTLYLDLDIFLFSHVFWDISVTSLQGDPRAQARLKGADELCMFGHFSFLPKLEVFCKLSVINVSYSFLIIALIDIVICVPNFYFIFLTHSYNNQLPVFCPSTSAFTFSFLSFLS